MPKTKSAPTELVDSYKINLEDVDRHQGLMFDQWGNINCLLGYMPKKREANDTYYGVQVADRDVDGRSSWRFVHLNRGTISAGPFSWPDIIDAINEHYIPVRTEPTPEQQQSLELVAYKFVEPGFLIVEPEGNITSRVDRITTMHPKWFRHLITRSVLQAVQPKQKSAALATAWNQFSNRRFEEVIGGIANAEFAGEEKCESELLRGMATFRQGQHAAAQEIWQSK